MTVAARPPCHPERSEGPLGTRQRSLALRARDDTGKLLALCVLILGLFALPVQAVEPSEILSDPVLERRARDIGRQLRCVVCQNQSIDDSSAEVARDMRRAVRERLSAGYNDAQVFDYMVARYGDYVLLNPPFKAETWALWLGGPLVLLLAGGTLLLAARRRSRLPLSPPPLTAHERERLRVVLSAARDVTPATQQPHPEEAEQLPAPQQPHPEEQPQAASRRVGPGNAQANDRGPGA